MKEKKQDRLIDRFGKFTVMPNSVIERWSELGVDALAMFLYLRYRSGQSDECFPSYDTIQTDTGFRRERISSAMSVLEAFGYLERRRRFSGSTVYILKQPSEKVELEEENEPIKEPISPTGGLMEIPPLVRQVDYISPTGGLPLVRQADTNKTHINQTHINQTQEEGENSFSPPSPIPSGEVEPFGVTATGTIEEYFSKPKPAAIQESGSEKIDSSAGGLIKNPGAFRALQRFEEKKGKIDVSRYPEDVRPVVYRFCQLSGMVPPEPSRKKGGEYSLWISSCRELIEAAGEFGPAAMEAVFSDRERERSPYSVYSPKSVVNAVRAKAGVLRMESKKKASDEGITMTDAELARVEKETQEMMQAYFASIERKPNHDSVSV